MVGDQLQYLHVSLPCSTNLLASFSNACSHVGAHSTAPTRHEATFDGVDIPSRKWMSHLLLTDGELNYTMWRYSAFRRLLQRLYHHLFHHK